MRGETSSAWISARDIVYSAKQPDGSYARILKKAGITANKAEVTGIIGKNGSGKTSLLKAIAALVPFEGGISVGGVDVRSAHPRRLAKELAFMRQNPSVAFSFTAKEVVAMGRYPWRGSFSSESSIDRRETYAAMELAQCLEYADKPAVTLSGGELQRVMLARCIAQQTPVMLLDEPASSLDIYHARRVFELCRFLAEQGKCIVCALHDLRQAARFCSTLYLIDDGEIIAGGKPEEVLSRENIKKAFGVTAGIYKNPAGEWDYYTEK
ncbi:MAG: ABC transporter ATP-binding protein [Christensenellales bacterium]|jgi:ABC-type cobalamin/Fe3+-siderophores transport system ATPase subunit